ncbi:MAG: hypothetical protein WCC10_03975 [Tumebacillaceae bacterium]
MDKLMLFIAMALGSALIVLFLLGLALQGRNVRRFRDRQRVNQDLYRFVVLILASLAIYLVGHDLILLRFLPLTDGALLFATTALPTLVLSLIAARWYLGYAAAVLVQAFILLHVLAAGQVQGDWLPLLLQNALCDLAGVLLYGLVIRLAKSAQVRIVQARMLWRFLEQQKAKVYNESR